MIELWSHWPKNEDEDDYPTTQWQFRDAIAMEETNSICLVNECGDFGFLDLRSIDMSVRLGTDIQAWQKQWRFNL
ncbi:BTB/POZ domain-containing protein [Camellia lanceoleosa]|uniref:BTB/POZ domain-containing protein n=1 Tax=Camellia lanceoleosa TaxID=1840588 RepID=A0ACC0I4T0_9ERIC|nr:BTB/POZ domain-containing protein [Camellia lanceoleosa]